LAGQVRALWQVRTGHGGSAGQGMAARHGGRAEQGKVEGQGMVAEQSGKAGQGMVAGQGIVAARAGNGAVQGGQVMVARGQGGRAGHGGSAW
jgi:hypothetical protein